MPDIRLARPERKSLAQSEAYRESYNNLTGENLTTSDVSRVARLGADGKTMDLKMGYQMSLNPLSVVRERQVRVLPPVQLIIIWVKAYVITMGMRRG